MLEIPGRKRSATYTLVMPRIYNLGGKVSTACFSNLGLPIRMSVKDPETDTKLMILQDYLPQGPLGEVIEAIRRQNEKTREELQFIFQGSFKEVDMSQDMNLPWRHIFDLPKNDLLDDRPEFNQQFTDEPNGPYVSVSQHDEVTELRIKQASYRRLYEVTRCKIGEALMLLNR